MDFQYVYIKKRSDFGRQCFFTNEPGALTCDIAPDPELAANFIHVNPVHRGTQVGCEMAEHEVSTDRAEFATTGVNHAEGGWARDINAQDVEQTTRFKKKVEKDDVYMSSVMTLGALVEHCIKQNNTLDMYEEYFGGEEGGAPAADGANNAKTVNVFRDPCPTRRAVANLSWSPDGTRLAAAYTSLRFQSSVWDLPVQSFVWDIENPSRPDFTMTPPDSLVSVEFNPKESFVLAGGTYRGRVCVFDRRRGPQPVELSPLEVGHADPVYSTVWVNSKSGAEVFTASTDGMVFWWDTRKLTEPIESLVLDVNKTQEPSLRAAQGATVLEYETTIPTKFMIGTEQGTVIQCNRKGKTQTEKIAAVYQAHLGPVKQVQRNPAFLKNFITIGDWSAKVWSEDCKESAIFWTNPGEVRLTGGSWSPSRPSVFFTSKADGTVDVWDVLYQQRLPVLTIQVGDSPLETLRVQESGALLAAGSADGQITLLELSDGLVDSGKNDRLVLTAMFERETRREKILEGKNREARLLKKMKEGGSAVSERPSTIAPTLTASARLEKEQTELELIEDAQTSFFDTVCKVKSARREVQLAQMAEKGVTAELDGADFQAPDISPDVPDEPQDAASGAALSGSASRKLASKTSSVGATKSSSIAAAKASSTAAAKSSSIAAAKASSTAAAKASSIAAASKTSFTAAAKKSSLAAAKKSSTAAAAAAVSSAAATRASSTAAAAVSSSPTDDSGSVTAETAGSSSLVTAPGDSEQPALGRALSVAEQIARVVDSLEEAVDDLLDPSRDETTEDTTGVTDDTTGETEA